MEEFEAYPEILIPEEVADILRMSPTEISYLLDIGEIPGVKLGSTWRVLKTRLLECLQQGGMSPQAPEPRMPVAAVDAAKIGELVRREMTDLLEKDLIADEELARLKTLEYSKRTFGLAFPLLKDCNPAQRLSEQRSVNGYPRYWNLVFAEKYLITSEWNERHRARFLAWLEGMRKQNS